MAEGGGTEDRFREVLECSICLELYTNPKMLKCTHEYCQHCVEEILTFEKDGSATITCPLRCSSKTVLTKHETVDDLATSYTIKHILDSIRPDSKKDLVKPPLCKVHEDCGQLATVMCCGLLRCENCYQNHIKDANNNSNNNDNNNKEHRKLNVVMDPRRNKLSVLCEKHSMRCDYLCFDDAFLCTYCLHRDEVHKQHLKRSLESEVTDVRNALKKQLEGRGKVEDDIAATWGSFRGELQNLKRVLKERKEKCLAEYREFINKEELRMLDEFTGMVTEFVEQREKLCEGLSFYQELMKKTDVELVVDKNEIHNHISDQIHLNGEISSQGINVNLCETYDFLSVRPLGMIQHSETERDGTIKYNIPRSDPNVKPDGELLSDNTQGESGLKTRSIRKESVSKEKLSKSKTGPDTFKTDNLHNGARPKFPSTELKSGLNDRAGNAERNSCALSFEESCAARKKLEDLSRIDSPCRVLDDASCENSQIGVSNSTEDCGPSCVENQNEVGKSKKKKKKKKKQNKEQLPEGTPRSSAETTASTASFSEKENIDPGKGPKSDIDFDSAQRLKSQGNDSFRQQKYAEAIDYYSKAIEKCPKGRGKELSVFYQNRAAANEKLQCWTKVVDDCSSALKLNPDYTKALYRRSEAYRALNQIRNSFQDVFTGITFDVTAGNDITFQEKRKDEILDVLSHELLKGYFETHSPSYPSVYAVEEHLQLHNYDVFEVPLSSDERDLNYQNILRSMKEGRYGDMMELCEKEIRYSGVHMGRALLLRATMSYLKRDRTYALDDLNEVAELAEKQSDNLLQFDALVKFCYISQEVDPTYDLVLHYTDIIETFQLGKLNATVHFLLGRYLVSSRRFEKAKQSFNASISLDANFLMPRIALCLCLYQEDRALSKDTLSKETEAAYIGVLKDFPNSSQAWRHYSTVLCNVRRFDEALRAVDRAITNNPRCPQAYVSKGMALIMHTRKYDVIEKLFMRALELDPKCGMAYRGLSILEEGKLNLDKSIEYIRKALCWIGDKYKMVDLIRRLETAKAGKNIQKNVVGGSPIKDELYSHVLQLFRNTYK